MPKQKHHMPSSQTDLSKAPLDTQADNWVDRYAPKRLIPWLRLMRADRPIGTWLLLLPCYFGLLLGLTQITPVSSWFNFGSIGIFILFAMGAIVMRGAGCTYNDIVDRDIDAKVERTALRPIPAGHIKPRHAVIFLIAQCLIGLIILLQFNKTTILLGFASLALVAAYPFMKRITWWPQLWLGLTFNWGALMGYSAMTGQLSAAAFMIYGAGIFWTLGYDTIYAHQDREDDALIGVRSTARKLGDKSQHWIRSFYWMTIALCVGAFMISRFSPISIGFILPAAAHLLRQSNTLDINNAHNCLKLFKSNRDVGFLLLLPFIVEIMISNYS